MEVSVFTSSTAAAADHPSDSQWLVPEICKLTTCCWQTQQPHRTQTSRGWRTHAAAASSSDCPAGVAAAAAMMCSVGPRVHVIAVVGRCGGDTRTITCRSTQDRSVLLTGIWKRFPRRRGSSTQMHREHNELQIQLRTAPVVHNIMVGIPF